MFTGGCANTAGLTGPRKLSGAAQSSPRGPVGSVGPGGMGALSILSWLVVAILIVLVGTADTLGVRGAAASLRAAKSGGQRRRATRILWAAARGVEGVETVAELRPYIDECVPTPETDRRPGALLKSLEEDGVTPTEVQAAALRALMLAN